MLPIYRAVKAGLEGKSRLEMTLARPRDVGTGVGTLSHVLLHLLAPHSGALRISAYRDFHPIPTLLLIAFNHLSLSMVI